MSEYILQHEFESRRLERQSSLDAYDYKKELSSLPLIQGASVLDVGCGVGQVLDYINNKYNCSYCLGIDASGDRVSYADHKYSSENILFAQLDISEISGLSTKFDLIVCRYVVEHLDEPVKAIKDMANLLTPEGRILLIDMDGLLSNLATGDQKYHKIIGRLQNAKFVDFQAGRKLSRYVAEAGLSLVNVEMKSIYFEGKTLVDEIELMRERFQFSRKRLVEILGEDDASYMESTFFNEIHKIENVYFYNKFIVTALNNDNIKGI